ncbi:ninjurin-1-like [Centruroides sculpturatus]|uniref:ninjurin-1-like n=1 Tax=Centruroides sculpturatus TaxID=218467 RepID=UPI000C6E5111|nr:ninjurin-1-like [Centruroides sculpturatus]
MTLTGSFRTNKPNLTVATKRCIPEALFDIALLSANASQLKYLLQNDKKFLFYPMIVLISLSITFQVVASILIIMLGTKCMKDEEQQKSKQNLLPETSHKVEKHQKSINTLNNVLCVIVLIITVINVLIPTIGIKND